MSFRIYKSWYVDRKTGQRRDSANFYLEFRDHHRVQRRWPAFADQKRTHALGEKLARLVECRRDGDAPDPKLARWLEGIDDRLRAKLVAADLIDGGHTAKGEPLVSHLEGKLDGDGAVALPGYKQHLLSTGDTAAHVALTVGRVRKIFDGCGFVYWKDLSRTGAATAIATHLTGLRDKGEISGRTVNYYCRAVRSFCRWMVDDAKRANVNPMASLRGVRDAEVDKVESRPLTVEELRQVVAAVTTGPLPAVTGKKPEPVTRYGMTAADRALLYRFAYETGIRPGQIRQLTVSAFDLDAEPPTVTARAATVKRRRGHVQVLRHATAAELKETFANRVPGAPAFPTMPDKFTLAEMFRADLADTRGVWIAEAGADVEESVKRQKSDFLLTPDHQGRRVNFYSLRHSHGTALGDVGIPQKDIAASLHHSRSATTDRYVHADIRTKAHAVAALPPVLLADAFGADVAQVATGTHGRAKSAGLTAGLGGKSPVDSGGRSDNEKTAVPEGNRGFDSEGDGARTRNHRIDSPGGTPPFLRENRGPAGLQGLPQGLGGFGGGPICPPAVDPDLTEIADAWEHLPPAIRAGILAMVRSGRPAGGG